MSFSFGNNYKITLFGQSHSECMGVVIDGIPAGIEIDKKTLYDFLKRRAPGKSAMSTPRHEDDTPRIISGLNEKGKTCGSPLTVIVKNKDVNDSHYEDIKNTPRPSHADYPAHVKYKGENDKRGGGSFSARLTVALCIAGGIAKQLLADKNINISSHISSIHGVKDKKFNPMGEDLDLLNKLETKEFPVIDDKAGEQMIKEILKAKKDHDSVGGSVECMATGLPVGLGNPPFDGVENIISKIVFSIPAVKAIEFGIGFSSSDLYGSENNDGYKYEDGKIAFLSNNHGGILGGLTTGAPLIFNVAFKPTPSIMKKQNTVNLKTGKNTEISVFGRHDPCVVTRAMPCVEAACAIALYDLMRESDE